MNLCPQSEAGESGQPRRHSTPGEARPTGHRSIGLSEQRRVVDVSLRPWRIEGAEVWRILRRPRLQATREIRVGEKRHAERHGIGIAADKSLLRRVAIEAAIDDEWTTE